MTAITSNVDYSDYICDCVNAQETTVLDNHVMKFNLLGDNVPLDLDVIEVAEPLFGVSVTRSYPNVSCVPRDDFVDNAREIYEALFVTNHFDVEYFDGQNKIRRPLSEDDIVISGSRLATLFYDITNTIDGTKMIANDVDVYILPKISKIYMNGHPMNGYMKSLIDFTVDNVKYQFISFGAHGVKNTYGFYDFDVCRGSLTFDADGYATVKMSQMMVSCMITGWARVGFHTTEDRVAKYIARGFGVLLIPGTIVVTRDKYYGTISNMGSYNIRGFNAVRSAHCSMCGKFHNDNREKLYLYQSICKKCFAAENFIIKSVDTRTNNIFEREPMTFNVLPYDLVIPTGYELLYAGKRSPYHIFAPLNRNEDGIMSRLPYIIGVLKRACVNHKIVLDVLNITRLEPHARKNIFDVIGMSEEKVLRRMVINKKYIKLSHHDPVFDKVKTFIEFIKESAVYKARVYPLENSCRDGNKGDLCLKVSLYVPTTDLLGAFIPTACSLANIQHKMKDYFPIVTNRRYKKFNDEVKILTKRVIIKQSKKVPSKYLAEEDAKDIIDSITGPIEDTGVSSYMFYISDSEEEEDEE